MKSAQTAAEKYGGMVQTNVIEDVFRAVATLSIMGSNHRIREEQMSKYDPLWAYIQKDGRPSLKLTFEQIQQITGRPIDHSFLKYKKDLASFGYQVGKISMKEQTVLFNKTV